MNAPPIAMMDQLDQPIAMPGQLPTDIMEALQNADSMEEIEAVSGVAGAPPTPPPSHPSCDTPVQRAPAWCGQPTSTNRGVRCGVVRATAPRSLAMGELTPAPRSRPRAGFLLRPDLSNT